jgi:glycosyltransferase involved in cell wall biosynthesis
MKVAVLSPHADGTGYSNAAIQMMLALDSVGIDVVARSVKMTNTKGEVPERVKQLESKDLDNVDVVYQYNLPSEFSYKGGVLNVGTYFYETSGFPNNTWRHNLNLMDLVIHPCESQRKVAMRQCGAPYEDKHVVVPCSVDTDEFNQESTPIDFGLPYGCTKFYTIAEFGRRKNIPALLAAYLSEFNADDNVALIIKTHGNGDVGSTVRRIVEDLKDGMKQFVDPARYPKIILMTDYMTRNQIIDLHRSCNIFVTASHGESWCLPAVDAMAVGNAVIAPAHGAFLDYLQNGGILVKGAESTVFGVTGAPAGLYTGDETWFNINIEHLKETMRLEHNNSGTFWHPEPALDRITFVENNLSKKVVGEQLKNVLEKALNAKQK